MKTRTEEELGENSLAETQQSVIRALEIGIDKLTIDIESCNKPDYRIEIKWGMCVNCLPSKIGDSEIEVVQLTPVTTTPQPKQTYPRRRRDRGSRRRQNPATTPDWSEPWSSRHARDPKNMYPGQAPVPKNIYPRQAPVPKNMYPGQAPDWDESWKTHGDDDWPVDTWS